MPDNIDNKQNATDYEIGYKKPPKSSQFKPGHSGNRKGRPKGSKGLKTDLREEMAERITINENGKSITISKQRLMVKSMVQKAAKGDVRAQTGVLELVMRVFGVEDESHEKRKLSPSDNDMLEQYLQGGLNEASNADGDKK